MWASHVERMWWCDAILHDKMRALWTRFWERVVIEHRLEVFARCVCVQKTVTFTQLYPHETRYITAFDLLSWHNVRVGKRWFVEVQSAGPKAWSSNTSFVAGMMYSMTRGFLECLAYCAERCVYVQIGRGDLFLPITTYCEWIHRSNISVKESHVVGVRFRILCCTLHCLNSVFFIHR